MMNSLKSAMKFIFCLITFTSLASPVWSFDFLSPSEYGTSAETIGLGNVQGFNTSSAVVFENPAGMSRIAGLSAAVMYSTILQNDAMYYDFSLAGNTPIGHLGFGFIQFYSNGFKATNKADMPLENIPSLTDYEALILNVFDVRSTQLKFAWQKQFMPGISVGISPTFYAYEYFQDTAGTFSLDVGGLISVDNTDFSLTATNILGASVTYKNSGATQTVPTALTLSVKRPVTDEFSAYLQSRSYFNHIAVSGAAAYTPNWADMLTGTVGYREEIMSSKAVKRNLDLGLQFNLGAVGCFYTYEIVLNQEKSMGIENKNYFSISLTN